MPSIDSPVVQNFLLEGDFADEQQHVLILDTSANIAKKSSTCFFAPSALGGTNGPICLCTRTVVCFRASINHSFEPHTNLEGSRFPNVPDSR